jgi:hypothetical protein
MTGHARRRVPKRHARERRGDIAVSFPERGEGIPAHEQVDRVMQYIEEDFLVEINVGR